jgi:hypothetical protein
MDKLWCVLGHRRHVGADRSHLWQKQPRHAIWRRRDQRRHGMESRLRQCRRPFCCQQQCGRRGATILGRGDMSLKLQDLFGSLGNGVDFCLGIPILNVLTALILLTTNVDLESTRPHAERTRSQSEAVGVASMTTKEPPNNIHVGIQITHQMLLLPINTPI